MDNSKILAEMSAEDIINAKVIKGAYDKLPEAFAEKLKDIYLGQHCNQPDADLNNMLAEVPESPPLRHEID